MPVIVEQPLLSTVQGVVLARVAVWATWPIKGSKTLFHLAAICAIRMASDLKAYYERKVAAGKHKMSVMSSMRNQRILRVFACVPDNKVYQKNDVHALA